jgi:hypothetical protein
MIPHLKEDRGSGAEEAQTKLHPATACSDALGWLARLCVTAVAVTLLLK